MQFHNPTAEVHIPGQAPETVALKRITHLGIGAHQDDLQTNRMNSIRTCTG